MSDTTKQPRSWRAAVLGTPVAAALGWIGYSALAIPHQLPLPPAVSGDRRACMGPGGRLSYYVAGEGTPLLLIHSINAAASAYEMRPLFEHYRQTRRVYAVDLPGFGFSERGRRDYTPRLYTDAILAMVEQIGRDGEPGPVDAMALSLSSEFLARAAFEHSARFRAVTLITATGFGKEALYGEWGSRRGIPALQSVFNVPLWSRAFFDLLNSRPVARYYLKQAFGSYEAIDHWLLEYDYLTAHRPGAQHAPYAFLSGSLFSADINRVYEALRLPVWLPYGERDQFTRFDGIAPEAAMSNWRIQPFATGGLPHFEQPEHFFAAYDAFLEQASSTINSYGST